MPLSINVPDSANEVTFIPLGGRDYRFEFDYNSRDKRYRISIFRDDISVVYGLKVVENANPTGKYDLVQFDHGELFILNTEQTDEPVGRDNFGIGKAYQLVYYTNSELQSLV